MLKGNWNEEDDKINQIAKDYFSYLFKASNKRDLNVVLESVHNIVTRAMNDFLTTPFNAFFLPLLMLRKLKMFSK